MDSRPQRLIVVSAVNFTEGGPLSILQDSLTALQKHFGGDYRIIALVHKTGLLKIPGVEFREFPRAKYSWIMRLFYEYSGFRRLSLELKPYLWLSLHDITPNVVAERRAVYCHNPAPFFRLTVRQALLEPVFWLFNRFYAYLYRININKNTYVIVQQDWLREKFKAMFGITNVIVAHPKIHIKTYLHGRVAKPNPFKFIFPAFPRVFKNFEVIGEAARILEKAGLRDMEIIFTFAGNETRYARHIARQFKDVRSIKLIGSQPRDRIFALFEQVDALIFPSRLETWGMPLTEFMQFAKPILAADLAYAHETLGAYEKVKYFDPQDALALSKEMRDFMAGHARFDHSEPSQPAAPFAEGWKELFELLLGDAEGNQSDLRALPSRV